MEGKRGAGGGKEGSVESVMVEKQKVVMRAKEEMPSTLPLCLSACPAAEAWGRCLLATEPGCSGA